MRVLLIGCRGSIGKRYAAIFKYLGIEFTGADLGIEYECSPALYSVFDKVLIATPTETHTDIAIKCMQAGCDVLIEKPVSTSLADIDLLQASAKVYKVDARMVCNWSYLVGMGKPGKNHIMYKNFHTGNDGLYWDCIQPIYLSDTIQIITDTPVFRCLVNGADITLLEMECSYINMIEDWIHHPERLWDLTDAFKATRKVKDEFVGGHSK